MAREKVPNPSGWEVDSIIRKLEKRAEREEETELSPLRDEVSGFIAGLEESIGAELDGWILYKRGTEAASELYKRETTTKMRGDGWDLLYDGPQDMKINPIPFTEQMIFEVSDGTKLVFKRAVNRKELK